MTGQVVSWVDAMADDEVLCFYSPKQQAQWEKTPATNRARWLLGQLWNCTDIVDSLLCDQLELPPGSRFAVLVRKLSVELR
jgi:hypothetical protein